jgi:peptidoglycan/xylan/chitin deacetylase (PgdA/CDA1 family)
MIGVLCSEEEKNAAREFFELFKTPWEFFNNKSRYDVVLATRAPVLGPDQADCLVRFNWNCSDETVSGQKTPHRSCKQQYFLYDGIKVPVYQNFSPFNTDGVPLIRTGENRRVIADRIINNGRTTFRIGFNLFKEVAHLLSEGQPTVNASIPTLDIHISILRSMILSAGIPLVEVPPIPDGHSSFVCLTHDVDFVRITNHGCGHTLCGFLYRATIGSFFNLLRRKASLRKCLINLGAALSLPLVYLGLRNDFWLQFDKYAKIEKDLKSTFFLIPFKNRRGDKVTSKYAKRRATKYDITDVQEYATNLTKLGHEVGVHGIDAWHDSEKGRLELDAIAKVIKVQGLGTRIHWLCFDSDSPTRLEDAGFLYDSTFGYQQTAGFRAGTAQVFRPLGVKRILEVPLLIQDVSLFSPSFLNMNEDEVDHTCKAITEQVLTFGGVLTILWHLRSAAPERLWGDFYRRLVDHLRKHRPWFATAGEVAEWFRARRAISFANGSFYDNEFHLQMESRQQMPHRRFVLRVYRPASNSTCLSAEKTVDYIDIPWSGEKSMTVPVQQWRDMAVHEA